ncbi:PAS domain S-box protein [Flavobacterium franklandianum]|uniref:Sensory/regulatory protein RpfC n=1 Tax=Flavobacterium franklandianum TaxID=2594430 RepID=A0A553C878_9FLAO|nr:PAS domain S-box protein [Flavobacterium franklandianum]TRX16705.1 PAS domain S-box protein [Flavobacterium franklandianum]TRX29611.1 PAS domain S-box protein [Flavobacterium franklandianum]
MKSIDKKLTYEELLQKTKDQESEIIRLHNSKKSETNLNFYFNESLDLICKAGTDGFYKEINPVFIKTLGYSKEDLLTNPLITFIHSDDLEKSKNEFEKLSQGISSINFENRLVKKNGEIVFIQWTTSMDISKETIYAIGRDITAITNTQVDLLESKKLHENAQKISKIGSWEYNFESRKMIWSNELYSIYELEKMDNQDLYQEYVNRFSKSDVALFLNKIKECKIDKNPFEVEQCAIINKDKSKWVHAIVYPIIDEKGTVIALRGNTQDVTEKKQLREILKLKKQAEVARKLKKVKEDSNAKFKHYIDNAPDGVFVLDEKGNYLDVNPSATLLTGYSKEELLTMKFGDLSSLESVEDYLEEFQNLLDNGIAKKEIKAIHKNGETRWLSVEAVKLSENRFLGFAKDITESKKAIDKIAQNEKHFRALLENNDGIISLIDENLNTIFRSASATRITGWNHQEFEKVSTKEYIHPDDLEELQNTMQKVMNNPGRPFSVLIRVKHKEGHYIWMKGFINNMLDVPEIRGIITNLKDVTKQVLSEKKIIKANRLYLFISQINQMIVRTTDVETLFKETCDIAVNLGKFKLVCIGVIDPETKKVIPRMLGGDDKSYFSTINTTSLGYFQQEDATSAAIQEGKSIICNDIENDSSTVSSREEALSRGYLSLMAAPIIKFAKVFGVITFYSDEKNFFDAEEIALVEEATGDVAFALENFEKESLRKKAEEAVFESENRYHTLTEVSPVGIFRSDETGKITYVNTRWSEIAGVSLQDVLKGKWVDAIHKEDLDSVVSEWENSVAKKTKSAHEFRFVHPDGSIVWVLGQSIPEINNENKVLSFIGTITNITELKLMETELIKAKELAEAANKAKTDFLANMSHEIRTPLNGIIGFTHLLMESNLKKNQAIYMATVNESANLLMHIVNDVLDFSKIESGKLELNIEEINLFKLSNYIVDLFKYQSDKKNIELSLSIDQKVPQYVLGDYVRIKQVLVNLLSNAIKFTGFGEIRLDINEIGVPDKKRSTIMFSVKDTGIGIKETNNERIFKSFMQEDNSTNRKFGGTGLGLAISNNLLALMNSKLELISHYGEGSNFFFIIKFRKSNHRKNIESSQTNTAKDKNSIPEIVHSDKKILIVEDNSINMLLAKKLVKAIIPNATIYVAKDGNEAIEKYIMVKPNLILMDIQMPNKNGYEAVEEIRKLKDSETIPIIALTAGIMAGDKEKCLASGMNDYLPKPIIREDLKQILNKWLNK